MASPPPPRPSPLDLALEAIAREHGLVFEDRVGSPDEHRKFWDAYDWSKRGEEWGPPAFVETLLRPHLAVALRPGIRVLEIGPGAGRVTAMLLGEGREVIAADVSERCLALVAERFGEAPGLRTLLLRSGHLDGIDPASLDLAVSYDAFVHFDRATVASYLEQLRPRMKVGAYGLVHHADTRKAGGWRGDVDLAAFVEMLVANDFVPLRHDRFAAPDANLLWHFDYLTLFAAGLRALFSERLERAKEKGYVGASLLALDGTPVPRQG